MNTPRNLQRMLRSVLASFALFSIACTGGDHPDPPQPVPTITAVSISPGTVTLSPGQTQQFTAGVTGTGNFSSAVNWTALGANINSSGLYTAPSQGGTFSVTATSAQDVSKFASATVSVIPPVSPLLTIILGAGCSGNPSNSQTYPLGTPVNYNYSVVNGYTNLVVKLDGVPVPVTGTITMSDSHTLTISATPPSPVGHAGEVFVTGGTLAGQVISSESWQINISPGATLAGNIQVRTNNLMGSGAVAPFGYTWTWGSRSTSITQNNAWIPTGSQSWSVPINLTAPSIPGTYYIIFGFQGEYDCEHVFSSTNWTYGSPVWNDGNDYWDMDASQLAIAHSSGFVPNWGIKFTDGMHIFDAPTGPIKVVVGTTTLLNEQFSGASVPSNWLAMRPSAWSVNSGVLQQNEYAPATRYILSYTPGMSWTNYRAEMDMWTNTFNSPASLNLYFRYLNYDNTYMYYLHSDGRAILEKRVGGIQTLLRSASGVNPNYLSPVRMAVEIVGSNIKAYRNGVLLFEAVDGTLFNGTIGFESIHTPGFFDNVLVVSK